MILDFKAKPFFLFASSSNSTAELDQSSRRNGITWQIGVPFSRITTSFFASRSLNGNSTPSLYESVSTTPDSVTNGKSRWFNGCVYRQLYPGGVITLQPGLHFKMLGLAPNGIGSPGAWSGPCCPTKLMFVAQRRPTIPFSFLRSSMSNGRTNIYPDVIASRNGMHPFSVRLLTATPSGLRPVVFSPCR